MDPLEVRVDPEPGGAGGAGGACGPGAGCGHAAGAHAEAVAVDELRCSWPGDAAVGDGLDGVCWDPVECGGGVLRELELAGPEAGQLDGRVGRRLGRRRPGR